MTRFLGSSASATAIIALLASLIGSHAIQASDIITSSNLTFFDQDFTRRPNTPNTNKSNLAKAKADKEPFANINNNTLLYSHSIIGFANTTTLEGSSIPTYSPTPLSDHPLANTSLPRNCERRIEDDKPLTKLCVAWLAKNPGFVMPSVSPTIGPSAGPSVFFEVVRVVDVVDNDVESSGAIILTSHAMDEIVDIVDEVDVEELNGNDNVTMIENINGFNSANTNSMTTRNTTTYSITYTVSPQDDTFIEQWRPREPLGTKDKLKIDATEDGVPTKVIMMKFALKSVFDDVVDLLLDGDDDGNDEQTTTSSSLKLTSATLNLYSMSDTTFGGYVSQIPSDWNEESVVWNDYVKDGKGGGKGKDKNANNAVAMLLPHDDDDDDDGKSSQDYESHLLSELGVIVSDNWYTTDLTSTLVNMFQTNASASNASSWEQEDTALALRISTDSSDGVIYESKEHADGNGPVLKLQFTVVTTTITTTTAGDDGNGTESVELVPFVVNGTSVENVTLVAAEAESDPTSAPSKTPTLAPFVMVRPFKPSESGEKTPIANANLTETAEEEIDADEAMDEASTSTSTSVVSSSFRMIITAIETTRRNTRNLRLLRANSKDRRQLDDDSHPSIDEKERSAITEHLTRVYAEVLSIAPTSISLVFEEDLVVEEIDNSGGNFDGLIRKSVFRVVAIFDDPNMSPIQSDDAARVLDQATIYAFVGPEEEEFIEVLKKTGEPIIDGPAEYDVTVLKVNYSVGGDDQDELQGSSSASTIGDAANAKDGEEDNASSSSSESSWLQPTLIAGASMIFFASSAAALILWKQRRVEDPAGAHNKPNDSPRSLNDATVPSTPSPNVFMDRFKNKKKFDYAEFEDDIDAEDPSSTGSACDAAMSPLTTHKGHAQIAETTRTTTHQNVNHQPANDIKFSQFQNVSFDDSSVSDVSAHLLGAKGSLKKVDPNVSQGESQLLLDTTMESYNMEAMSALDQVRFEDVLNVDGLTSSPTHKTHHAGGIDKVKSEDSRDNEDGSLSTGAVPSELYSNLSIDSSMLHSSHVDTSGAIYGGHLFTLDMLRNKDNSLLQMPPPPSDAASDSSSQQDVIEDINNIIADPTSSSSSTHPIPASSSGIENVPMREKNEQNAVSQCINDELTKVMNLLRSPEKSSGQTIMETEAGQNDISSELDESVVHIGNVNAGTPDVSAAVENEDRLSGSTPTNANPYDGVTVLMGDESSTDAESDVNDPLKEMNNALSDCMDILEKARFQNRAPSNFPYAEKTADVGSNVVEEDELSLVSERLY